MPLQTLTSRLLSSGAESILKMQKQNKAVRGRALVVGFLKRSERDINIAELQVSVIEISPSRESIKSQIPTAICRAAHSLPKM